MTKREPKDKIKVPTRTARPKGDMFNNLRKPEEIESLSIEELVAPHTDQAHTNHTPTTHQPAPIAPERNFARVPNSVALEAIPTGLFRGESLKTWHALYQRTRGAVVPRRSIRATKAEVMEWAGISHNTYKTHMRHLEKVGLVIINYRRGDRDGAEYEVFVPEERKTSDTDQPLTNQALAYHSPTSQNLVTHTNQNLVLVGVGQMIEETTTSENRKTSFNTNTERDDDDTALAGLVTALKTINRELTGKDLSHGETDRWRELAEVLIAELRIAAARTTVSSVPAFLAEHLRRRLWKIDKKQARAEGRELPDQLVTSGPVEQPKDCPDCGGSGWWYPNGLDRGVAKCKHSSLKKGNAKDIEQ